MSSDASVSLTLLDGFTLSHRGKPISLPLRAQRVLGFLAFQDLPVLRVYVAGSLWPDVPERRAAGSLRSALWRLSHLAFRVVDATPHTLRLAPSVVVDAREVVDWSRRVIHGSDETDLEGVRFRASCCRTGTTTGSSSNASNCANCGCTRSRPWRSG
jgi:DNA-binding SARP family transcriptional activator